MPRLQRVHVEVRPGEGGEDATLFAHELTAAFSAYARRHGADVDRDDRDRTLVLLLVGPEQMRRTLAGLSGVHRIQRIPANDRRGRRHTSTATVAVLDCVAPERIELRESDLEEIAARGSGPGGQHRNTSDTKVTVIHRPTRTAVTVNRGRSQWQNRQLAREELVRRLSTQAATDVADRIDQSRAEQIASSERPAKAFTHNTQRNEVVDHEGGPDGDLTSSWTAASASSGRRR